MSDEPIDLSKARAEKQGANGDFEPMVSFEGIDLPEGYMAGMHAGMISSALSRQDRDEFRPVAIRAQYVEVFERIAEGYGYELEVEASPDPFWVWPTFRKKTLNLVT